MEGLLTAFSSFSIATPWVLTGLIVLPLLWWLLKLSPPSPKEVRFPAYRLLEDLADKSQIASNSPLWLIILRSLIIFLVLLALSGPILNADRTQQTSSPLIILLDDSWPAAQDWSKRLDYLDRTLKAAAGNGRQVALMLTADPESLSDRVFKLEPAERVRMRVQSLNPHPFAKDLNRFAERFEDIDLPASGHVIWIHDGLAHEKTKEIATRLQRMGSLQVISVSDRHLAALTPLPEAQRKDPDNLPEFRVIRPDGVNADSLVTAQLIATDGRTLSRTSGNFPAGKDEAGLRFDLPVALRNEAVAVRLEGQSHAGSIYLLDSSWHRPLVGLAQIGTGEENRTLLDGAYYLQKALAPHAELSEGPLAQHIDGNTDLILLDDEGRIAQNDREKLQVWVERGGLLLRFAGPRLIAGAAETTDMLLPAPLRQGGRSLSGALTWTKPLSIGTFNAASPLADLDPASDTLVRKQVLAEPGVLDEDQIWARLSDGTPLITARQMGKGWLVLVHTGASPSWSDLPFSGLFVNILDRLAHFSAGTGALGTDQNIDTPVELVRQQSISAFGEIVPVSGVSTSIQWPVGRQVKASSALPPGVYQTGATQRIVNLLGSGDHLVSQTDWPSGTMIGNLAQELEIPLKGWLLTAAMILFLIDILVILGHKGLLKIQRPGLAAFFLIAIIGLALPETGKAQEGSNKAELSALSLRLAYIKTGDTSIDRISERGLVGLTNALIRRTAVEPSYPMPVDPEVDELLFYPMIYWPVSVDDPVTLSPEAVARIQSYLNDGGTILFDTRIELNSGKPSRLSQSPELKSQMALRELLDDLDLPSLSMLDQAHILTRSFYLLEEYPGRYKYGHVWVEQTSSDPFSDAISVRDGVSSVVIGSNDWASAWAVDDKGYPMSALVPGSEGQRENAYRFGINLVMYALTGNYKADQVHAPAILERLGQ